jgi:hypothetical protein
MQIAVQSGDAPQSGQKDQELCHSQFKKLIIVFQIVENEAGIELRRFCIIIDHNCRPGCQIISHNVAGVRTRTASNAAQRTRRGFM